MLIQVSGNRTHLAQNYCSIRNLPTNKTESFLKLNFDLSQICQLVLAQKHEI